MLIVITGPMFAGKTSKLFDIISDYYHSGRSCQIFKPENDTRYGDDYVSTHDGRKMAAITIPKDEPERLRVSMEKLILLPSQEDYGRTSVFAVDEAQFFEPNGMIKAIEGVLYNKTLPVRPIIILSGLSQDSCGRPFGAMPHLLAIADDIIHCKAVCSVSKRIGVATRTKRKNTANGEQILVGGAQFYEPRSFEYWI